MRAGGRAFPPSSGLSRPAPVRRRQLAGPLTIGSAMGLPHSKENMAAVPRHGVQEPECERARRRTQLGRRPAGCRCRARLRAPLANSALAGRDSARGGCYTAIAARPLAVGQWARGRGGAPASGMASYVCYPCGSLPRDSPVRSVAASPVEALAAAIGVDGAVHIVDDEVSRPAHAPAPAVPLGVRAAAVLLGGEGAASVACARLLGRQRRLHPFFGGSSVAKPCGRARAAAPAAWPPGAALQAAMAWPAALAAASVLAGEPRGRPPHRLSHEQGADSALLASSRADAHYRLARR